MTGGCQNWGLSKRSHDTHQRHVSKNHLTPVMNMTVPQISRRTLLTLFHCDGGEKKHVGESYLKMLIQAEVFFYSSRAWNLKKWFKSEDWNSTWSFTHRDRKSFTTETDLATKNTRHMCKQCNVIRNTLMTQLETIHLTTSCLKRPKN